jgi:uncharacterized membrane protein YhfC
MTDFPEKPKNTETPSRRTFDWKTRVIAIITAAAVGLPMGIAFFSQRSSDMLLDVLLLGVIACCLFFLAYQGVRWIIQQQAPDDNTLNL